MAHSNTKSKTYTALTFDSKDTADKLRKSGGFIPGIRPGKNSADYIDCFCFNFNVFYICIEPGDPILSNYRHKITKHE
jgi:hypothetical protein